MSMAMEDPMGSYSSSTTQTISTTSFFTPLLISIMGIGATALAILFYHLLLVRYCMRRHAARMAALRAFASEEIPAGVDEKTLLTIPIITYKKRESESVMDRCECAVCLGNLDDGDVVRLLPNCKHLFHVKCIDEWFVGHNSCPVCRVSVVAPFKPDNLASVATDDLMVRSCPVCRSVGTTVGDDVTSVGSDDLTGDDGGGLSSGPQMMLRHCHSLVLPRERKGRFTGMELKRSLSMGQSGCVVVDINIDNVGKDCTYYSTFKDESVRQFHRMSSKVKHSISRICVGQEQGSGILPY